MPLRYRRYFSVNTWLALPICSMYCPAFSNDCAIHWYDNRIEKKENRNNFVLKYIFICMFFIVFGQMEFIIKIFIAVGINCSKIFMVHFITEQFAGRCFCSPCLVLGML